MKYRVLLAGKNRAIVDDFFRTMDDRFECLTTSNRSMDMANHMRCFEPHAFVYCFASESKDDIIRLTESFDVVDKEYRQIILIGDPEHCDEFKRRKPEMVKMVLYRPITANSIKEKLIKYFEKNKIGLEKSAKELEMEKLMAMTKAMEEEQAKVAEKAAADKAASEAAAEEAAIRAAAQEILKKQHEAQGHGGARTMASNAPVPPKPQNVAAEPAVQSAPGAEADLKHVLVIDDDPMMLRLVKAELKDRYNVATAVSGKVGLKFLERKTTDLILLDYEMPEENGAQVLEKLRENPATKGIPVVFLTGMNNREKIKQLVAMKPQGYLLKPIKCEQLVETIRQLIG